METPKHETIRKLQKRKLLTREYAMRDTKLSPVTRVCIWFMLDCITLDKTALEFQTEKIVVINPAQQTIAYLVGVSRKTVNLAVQEAIEHGYFEQLYKGNGIGGSSEYRVMSLRDIKAHQATRAVA